MSQKLDSCSKQPSLLFLQISKFNMCSMQCYESLCYLLKSSDLITISHHSKVTGCSASLPSACGVGTALEANTELLPVTQDHSCCQMKHRAGQPLPKVVNGYVRRFITLNAQTSLFPTAKQTKLVWSKIRVGTPLYCCPWKRGTWSVGFCSSTWSWPPLEMNTARLSNVSCTENCIHIGDFITAIKGRKHSRRVIRAKGNAF